MLIVYSEMKNIYCKEHCYNNVSRLVIDHKIMEIKYRKDFMCKKAAKPRLPLLVFTIDKISFIYIFYDCFKC